MSKLNKLEFGLQRANKMGRDAEEENQQLKQQLHDLPKKIVEEIRTHFLYGIDGETTGIDIILDAILEKYGGEDE